MIEGGKHTSNISSSRAFSLVKHKKAMLIVILGALGVVLTGLFVSAYAVPQLKSIFTPHPWSLYPPPAEHELIDVYFNQTSKAHALYSYTGTVEAKKLEVKIHSFSRDLKLLTPNNETITAPYSWHVTYRKFEARPVAWEFQIIAPNKTAEYEINLSYIVSNGWLSSREYPQKIRVRVAPMPHKPKPEETLTVTLDKETYHQGDTMNIAIENISNETQWFGNAAYDVCFERFNGDYWEFYDSIPGAEVITCLRLGETGHVTWKLGGHTDRPFPPGRYRVETHGVYAEFEVKEVQLSELETIIIEFLKTTDVPNGGWDDTVEILETYDHKSGGKVIVVNYTTANAVHPHFMCEAIEHHTAVITLNEKEQVVSAFCVWGTLHGPDKIWDLINQRWIQK